MSESQPLLIVGRCLNCGREYLTLPRDMRDVYGVRTRVIQPNGRLSTAYPTCGGRVTEISSNLSK